MIISGEKVLCKLKIHQRKHTAYANNSFVDISHTTWTILHEREMKISMERLELDLLTLTYAVHLSFQC